MDQMSLCFRFPDGSNSFVSGYEAGLLGARMALGEEEIISPLPYHTDNLELFRGMSEHYGYSMTHQPTEFSEWSNVEFLRKPPEQKIPFLRLVKG